MELNTCDIIVSISNAITQNQSSSLIVFVMKQEHNHFALLKRQYFCNRRRHCSSKRESKQQRLTTPRPLIRGVVKGQAYGLQRISITWSLCFGRSPTSENKKPCSYLIGFWLCFIVSILHFPSAKLRKLIDPIRTKLSHKNTVTHFGITLPSLYNPNNPPRITWVTGGNDGGRLANCVCCFIIQL